MPDSEGSDFEDDYRPPNHDIPDGDSDDSDSLFALLLFLFFFFCVAVAVEEAEVVVEEVVGLSPHRGS